MNEFNAQLKSEYPWSGVHGEGVQIYYVNGINPVQLQRNMQTIVEHHRDLLQNCDAIQLFFICTIHNSSVHQVLSLASFVVLLVLVIVFLLYGTLAPPAPFVHAHSPPLTFQSLPDIMPVPSLCFSLSQSNVCWDVICCCWAVDWVVVGLESKHQRILKVNQGELR